MAPAPLDSEETRRLLDTISSLDDLCVLFVNQPQIIVVGDQGSGKSSVLEAIARIPFPVGEGVCTRFPIELVLRRAPKESTYLEVLFDTKSLDVGGRSFSRTTRTTEPFSHTGFPRSELPALIARAKEHIGLGDGKATGFSRDVLLIEIEGPDVPSVTLVDLPGVIHPGFTSQLQDWKLVVDDLVDSYMRRPNSIILTVVSADVPLSAHAVLNRAARFDPEGDRTIGVITKPDLCPSTNLEDQYIKLAKGQTSNQHLPLGWHVLRNRGSKEAAMSYDERDFEEEDFLADGTRRWWRLPLSKVGVDGLRKNLAETLLKHIKSKLPDLIEEVENEIETRQERLKRIGAHRTSVNEIRDYLLGISATFHSLAEHAVDGRYNDPFFASSTVQETSKTKFRKLRALLRNLNRAFDLTMKRKGARYKIQWEQELQQNNNGVSPEEQLANFMADVPEYLQPYLDLYDFPDPTLKAEATITTRIERIASNSQGVEFPGVPNSDLIMQLFRDLSEPWPRIAQRHIDIFVERTRLFVYHLFDYILGDDKKTRDGILSEYVDPAFESIIETLNAKLAEILRPYTSGHGLPLDLEFRTGLTKRKLERITAQIAELMKEGDNSVTYNTTSYRLLKYEDVRNIVLEANAGSLETDFGTDVVIDMMLTHYEGSLKTFTDNVIYLVIENCLVSNLPDIFSAKIVTQMSDDKLRQIAEEPTKAREERIELNDEIEKLRLGLQECQRFRPRNFSEPADNFPELTSPTRTRTTRVSDNTKPPETPVSSSQNDVKRRVRVRLPPFAEYAKTTSPTESPFAQVGSDSSGFTGTSAGFTALLKKEPDISFSASLKGKAPVFSATVEDAPEDDDEKTKGAKLKHLPFDWFKPIESDKPTPSLFGSKAPAAKGSIFGSGATTTTTPVTVFGSVPASGNSGSNSAPDTATSTGTGTGSTTTTTPAAVKPAFGSPSPPKPTVGSTSGSTTASAAPAPAFGSVPAAKPSLFGAATTTSQASTAPKPSLFGAATTTSQTPAPKPSLFGTGTVTAPSPSPSPKPFSFGSGAATTSQAPIQIRSFFGTKPPNSQTPATTSSLFGNSTTSQAPVSTSSLFGNSTTSTATTAATSTTAAKTAETVSASTSDSTPSKTPSTDGVVGSPAAPSLSGTEKSLSSSANA